MIISANDSQGGNARTTIGESGNPLTIELALQ